MADEIEPGLRRSKGSGKSHKRKQYTMLGIIAVVLILGIASIIGYQKIFNNIAPVDTAASDQQLITVPKGASTKSIAALLEQEGLVRSKTSFEHYVRQNGYDGKLRNGEYVLSANMSVEQIVSELLSGIGDTMKFTIPEGYTLEDIASTLVSQGLMSEADFWQTIEQIDISAYDYIQDVPDDHHRLEGYLFPDTYIIAKNATPEAIIQAMLKRFDDVYRNLPVNETGLDAKSLVILASLVESEARLDDDRPLIASVYLNRIAEDMPLQCDATILYAMPEHKERLYYSDYEYDSPYNTYLFKGFPPTPICNPGEKSLIAASQPAESDYLYYLWNKESNGGHVFAETYKEHLQNRKKYGYN